MARRIALIACFLMTSLASVGLGSQEYDRCGHMFQFGDCMEFWPLHPAGARGAVRSLPGGSYSPFVVYRAIGDSTACDTTCGLKTYQWCVTLQRIEVCPGDSLGCGIVQPHDDVCGGQVWWSPVHGNLWLTGPTLAAGDTVEVIGIIDTTVLLACSGDGALANQVVRPCAPGLAIRPRTWGGIKAVFR